jgi:lipopolysaccharide export LptBFGC system permease protein LptF
MLRKKILYLIFAVIGALLLFKYCEFKKQDNSSIDYNTNLIQQQIVNVGKLVVTEGHFSQVLTYKDQDKYFMDLISFDKKALIVVNAEATVSYDLRQMKYDIDEKNKTITILNIPKEEIKISPDIQFYDVTQSTLNHFTGDDYNKINKAVRANLAKKIGASALKANAQNRLISELSKILILTNTMGWKLQYNGKTFDNQTIDNILL